MLWIDTASDGEVPMIRTSSTPYQASAAALATAPPPPLIDHPVSQPLDFQIHSRSAAQPLKQNGIYLRFQTQRPPRRGSQLLLSIEAAGETHSFRSQVVQVDRSTSPSQVVVWIGRKREAFAARMVEQLCHIAHYRLLAATNEGRSLSLERAANEWIARFAAHFPGFES